MTRRRSRPRRGLPTVGLIVEGDTEYASLPRLHTKRLVPNCPPLHAINLGGLGQTLSAIGIARRIAPKVIAHVQAGRSSVVVCFDRENRQECAPGLATEVSSALADELVRRGKHGVAVCVVVVDRAFEAWILADAAGLVSRGHFVRAPTFRCFEGQSGSQSKKGTIEISRLLDRDYDKTRDGPRLFERLDFTSARQHGAGARGSKSLDKFLRCLGV